jgi:hypothetical protein
VAGIAEEFGNVVAFNNMANIDLPWVIEDPKVIMLFT